MTVNRDLNLGTVVTLAIFLGVQSGTAIWWASKITTQLGLLASTTQEIQGDVDDRNTEVSAEQLRQWDRINSVETTLSRVDILNGVVQDQLKILRAEAKINNDLLREVLVRLGPINE